MEQSKLFKLVDEIDHYTIKLPGEEVENVPETITMIYHYAFADRNIEEKLNLGSGEVEKLSPAELYKLLRVIRETLLSEAFENS